MIFLGDLRIKACIELFLEDISKNEWLINDVLGDTVANPYLVKLYGSQIESCKQWLKNNRINIFMSERDDRVEFPCVVIEMGTSNEKAEMKHMADLSTQVVNMIPNNINKPIPYVVKPLSGTYDTNLGTFTFSSPVDLNLVGEGMILLDPASGTGYVINSNYAPNTVMLTKGLTLKAERFGIIPKYQYYQTRIGHSFFTEPYKITVNAIDQQTCLWLHSIVVYALLRYRQSLLEADGYAESMISSGKMYPNLDFSDTGQVIWSRDVNITGQVENRWLEQPHRIIETANLGQEEGYVGGALIISNITDTFEDLSTVNWSTIADEAAEGDAEFDS